MTVGARAARWILVLHFRARRGVALRAPAIVVHVGAAAKSLLVLLQHLLSLQDTAVEVWVGLALVLITEHKHRLF